MTRGQQFLAAAVLALFAFHLGKKAALKQSTSAAATVPPTAAADPLAWLGFAQ